MPSTQSLESAVSNLIIDLCRVLYQHGYREISVGALMRIIGVNETAAVDHDDHLIDLDQHFAKSEQTNTAPHIPPGTVFH